MKPIPGSSLFTAFLLALLVHVSPAAAQRPSYPAKPGEVIIKFKGNATASERNKILAELGARDVKDLPRGAGKHAHIANLSVEDAIRRYRGHGKVEFIEPNYIYKSSVVPNDPRLPELWGMENHGQTGGTPGADIRATLAWAVSTGSQNVLVAITDTGLDYNHPDLAANAWVNPNEIPGNFVDDDHNGFVDDVRGWDFANNDNDPIDDHYHGTHVAGTVGAIGNNGVGVVGVNWHVKILPIKFLDAFGSGTTDAAVRSVDYAARMGAKVINASWGGGGPSEALRIAIENAGLAGGVFVAAAGNASNDNDVFPFYPSNYDVASLIAVAATDHNDALAWFSNYGATTVDLAAPGDAILSTMPGGYGLLSGTSMAAPHVSGALGLIFARFPNMTAVDAKNLLLARVDPRPNLAGRVLTGGRLNAFMPIAEPDSIPPGPVTNLTVAQIGGKRVTLRWTAPGDDGPTGTATRYEIRHSTAPINDGNFGNATAVPSPPNPSPGGTLEQFDVTGLQFGTTYYFALKARDEFGNASPLSNVPNATTPPPPDIGVTPSSLSADLLTGQQATRVLTVSNSGPSELVFQVSIRGVSTPDSAANLRVRAFPIPPARALTPAVAVPTDESPAGAGYGPLLTSYVAGHAPSQPAVGPADIRIANLLAGRLRVLILQSGADVSQIRTLLAAYPDIEVVDVFDGQVTVPTLAQLMAYQAVLVVVNVPFANAAAIGDVLADYVDAGGGVVPTLASFIGQWDIGGRFRNEGYMPFSRGTGPIGLSTLGAHNAAHPIMAGVTSVTGDLLGDTNPEPGTDLVASWTNNEPLVATKGRVAGVNIFVGATGFWAGDLPLLLHNALHWAGSASWLSVDPTSGVVPSGGQLGLVVTFDAEGLDGGDYDARVVIASDDPDESEVEVPAHLHVTGVPDIAVTGEVVRVESAKDYSADAARTTHHLVSAVTPGGPGSIELVADGDYGDPSETAAATTEDGPVGSVGGVGLDCMTASGRFALTESRLNALLADGAMDVEVQNTFNVNFFCPINRHTVRLEYAGPADHLDFGPLFIGLTRELSVLIRNAGTQLLHVTSIASDQPAFAPGAASLDLPPREQRNLVIRFSPAAAQHYAGTLTIRSDDPDEPEIRIALGGEGILPPDVAVEPTEFNESLLAGGSVTRTLTIRNEGASDLEFAIRLEEAPPDSIPPDSLQLGLRSGRVRASWRVIGPDGGVASTILSGAPALATVGTKAAATALAGAHAAAPAMASSESYAGPISSSKAPDGFRTFSLPRSTMANAGVLLIEDTLPWGTMANEALLSANGIAYDVIPTGAIASTDLTRYGKVIVASDQPTFSYQQIAQRQAQIEQYVSRGGVLEFHAAGWGWQSGDASLVTLPGGMRINFGGSGVNFVLDPSHPLMAGVPNPFTGNGASHSYFTQIPAGATQIASDDFGRVNLVEYRFGRGVVVSGCQTFEYGYANFQDAGLILRNMIPYGFSLGPQWLTASPLNGRVPPGNAVEIQLVLDATGLLGGDYESAVVVASNDPDESELRVPVRLHVTGVADIAVTGGEVTVESTQSYTVPGALTRHRLEVSVPAVGDGTFDLTADGDYGLTFEVAVMTVEGLRLGQVGGIAADCNPAHGSFPMAAADLAPRMADGVVEVEVQNSAPVDAFCAVNEHRVRLRYQGALLQFGSMFVGLCRSLTVQVTNQGTDDLHVEPLLLSGAGFTASPATGFSLDPFDSQTVVITFCPVAPGVVEGSLTVRSDDPDEPEVVVRLQGEGLPPPDIAVSPTEVSETLLTGASVTRTLTIRNEGQHDLDFTIRIDGSPDSLQQRAGGGVRAAWRVVGREESAASALGAGTAPRSGVAGAKAALTAAARAVAGATAGGSQPGMPGVPDEGQWALLTSSRAPEGHRWQSLPPSSMANADVLLIEDALPWGSMANEALLAANGIAYDVIPTSAIAGTDLSRYGKVIVASDQPTFSYQQIAQRQAQIDQYVSNGGVLEFHAAGWGWQSGDASLVTLPGGMRINLGGAGTNYLLDPSHPLVAGVPNPFFGGSASHSYFTQIPAAATQIVADDLGRVNLVEYRFGRGRVVSGGQTFEYGYTYGQSAGQILANMIPYLFSPGPEWLTVNPLDGRVAPGDAVEIQLVLDATGLIGGDYEGRVVVLSNDPDESELRVPVRMHVIGVPDIALLGTQVTVESAQSYSLAGALTRHALAVPGPADGDGTLEIEADGDYGHPLETAALTVEGLRLGEVGGVGLDCLQARGSFTIAAADLAPRLADGVVEVEVQNSIYVDAVCALNQHRVRLVYRRPAGLDFGSFFVGLCRSLTVEVGNQGTDDLHVGPLVVTGTGFAASPDSGFSLDPGESRTLTVTFCPVAPGVVEGSLAIRSDDPDEAEVVVALRGEGLVPPDIAITPTALNEALLPGQTSEQRVLIANHGGSALSVRVEIGAEQGPAARAATAARASAGTAMSATEVADARGRYEAFASAAHAQDVSPARGRAARPAVVTPVLSPNAVTIFFDDMESGVNGWTHQSTHPNGIDLWAQTTVRSNSGNTSWHVSQHDFDGADALQSPVIDLQGYIQASLSFAHWYRFDDCFGSPDFEPDGGIVEVSEVGTGTWTQIHPVGGYPYVLDNICGNPLAFKQAYSHGVPDSVAFPSAVFDLTPYAGKKIQIRFHAGWDCGNCGFNEGWYVDDVGVFSESPRWVQASPASGNVPPNEVMEVTVRYDASGLSAGVYPARLLVHSNDPDESELEVPIQLLVADVPAALDVMPTTLNLGRRGSWLTCILEFPGGQDPAAVDVSSLRFNHVVPAAPSPTAVGDEDGDGIPDLMVKFDFEAARATLVLGPAVHAIVTGTVGASWLLATDDLRVIGPQLLKPSGGGAVAAQSVVPIEWDPADAAGPNHVDLYFSADAGVSWSQIASDVQGTSYLWTVPDVRTRHALVRADFHDRDGLLNADANDRVFEIQGGTTAIADERQAYSEISLLGAPNPFQAAAGTNLRFTLPTQGTVELCVFNAAGSRVRVLASGWMPAGRHDVRWDGRDDKGVPLGPGLYFGRLRSSGAMITRRIVLLR